MSTRARQIAAPSLPVAAAIALLAALAGGYATRALVDSDQFADRAAAVLDDEAVATEIGRRVADALVVQEPDLIAVRPIVEQVVSGVVGGGAFRSLFRAAVADLHRTIFDRDQSTVTLTLADIGATARGALQALNPKLAGQIPAAAGAELLVLDPPGPVAGAVRAAEDFRPLPWLLLALGLALAVVAIRTAVDRRLAVLVLGIAIAVGAVISVAALRLVRALVVGEVADPQTRAAAQAIFDTFLGDLRTALLLAAACGAVIAAAASSLLAPVDAGAPLRRVWQLVGTVPSSSAGRALRGVLLVAVGIAIVARPGDCLELAAILAGLYVAYAGASELLRLTVAREREAGAQARRGRRALAGAGVVALAVIGAAALFVGAGGAGEQAAAVEVEGCNGQTPLCDAPLDRVAFPATHNSMSAATNPGWLFAQQEKGLADQLADGIRGLLIDAHYGVETADGTIKTDLSDLEGGERATFAASIGEQALDAALRIRDRIVDSPVVGKRAVYLCHGFCEPGALPIETGLGQVADFLAANPDQVIVIVIEDYVAPEDIAAAVKASGLLEHVYAGPLDPLPTLGAMSAAGGQALILAEHDAGGGSIPWYHPAYEALVQETPFSFKRPGELIDPGRLEASCEPNRGPGDAPLFLINHWIDTSPAPRPSNAAKVNAHEALLRRVRHCERQRGLVANLIAVDFYLEGDVFGVADELNEERLAAPVSR